MKHLDDEINKTLGSLDSMDRAMPSDAFKTQVLAQWESHQSEDRWSRFLKMGIAAMILMCLANVLVLLSAETTVNTVAQEDFSTQVVEHFMDTSDPYESNYE